ncbi:hypothetical protein ACFPOI_20805 [Nonomuraea angiospora]|uniref:Cytochrome c-type biogenesis protein CcmE n=1 Tax=Nonomuraea angiospora TaxID=46172 RepID=A0ABR9MJI1_9ACTN|nr:hypothetical protein [Nonomuraea angiospora]MBE1593101.1 cytochrome c-type biogenesis protein CcmE [Nonomuraea angiospora]
MAQLDSSPYPDDLGEELAVQPRKGTSKLTLALAAGVVLVAGILIGIQAANLFGSPAASAAGAQQRPGGGYGQQQGGSGQQRGGFGQPPGYGGGQRMGGGGGGTIGTVEKVEGGKVYVKTMDGSTVTVTTDDRTTVQISKPGKVSDLRTGTSVVVRGQQGGDGSVTATSITQGNLGGGPR